MSDKFKHGKDESAAREYLKEIGVYDKVVQSSPVGDQSFVLIIAANKEFETRNKIK